MSPHDAVVEAEQPGIQSLSVGYLHAADHGRQSVGSEPRPDAAKSADLSRLLLAGARSRLLAEIVGSLQDGTQFVALTGAPDIGKTFMAAAIREELTKSSVSVRWVDDIGRSGIRLRTIMAQILGKPETEINDGDIEQMFDAMTERDGPSQRQVLIIDGAEKLLPDAIGYLRLLASIAIERMPQILFIGDHSFWQTIDQPPQGGLQDLIGARFELEPLSPREAGIVAQRLMSALSPTRRPVFDRDALEMFVQQVEGRLSRLFPLAAAIAAVTTETDNTRVTTAVIEAAVARLEDGLESFAPQYDGCGETTATKVQSFPMPADGWGGAAGPAGALVATRTAPHRERRVARLSAAVSVVASLGLAASWLTPIDIHRVWAETSTALTEPNAQATAVPDAMIIVRVPASLQLPGQNIPMFDDTAAVDAIAVSVPPAEVGSDRSVANPKSAFRKRTAQTRPAPPVSTTRANTGTWLFPPNPNG